MTPFIRAQYEPQSLAATQNDLMAKPLEFFSAMFGGRVPSLTEKLNLIRESMVKLTNSPVFVNDLYTVQVEHLPPFIHLVIRRNDWETCKDWRHFQQIKNQLVG